VGVAVIESIGAVHPFIMSTMSFLVPTRIG
jgi:hypothetical protein